MTTPDLRSIMPGRKARSRRTAASRLTSSILCQSSSESPSNPPAFGSQPRRSHDGWLCWLPCRSAPDRVCRAAFDHSRCVMDTCGLERVERFRINLNEKNFACQNNTLTSSLLQRCRAVCTYGSGQRYACQCILRPCCCETGIEFGWHWPEATQACLSGTRPEG